MSVPLATGITDVLMLASSVHSNVPQKLDTATARAAVTPSFTNVPIFSGSF